MLGAVGWDIRTDLVAHGMTQQELVDLFAGTIGIAQTVLSWYNGLLAMDDDNGNLNDGTPHGCYIWGQFDAHSCAGMRWPGVPTTPYECSAPNTAPWPTCPAHRLPDPHHSRWPSLT